MVTTISNQFGFRQSPRTTTIKFRLTKLVVDGGRIRGRSTLRWGFREEGRDLLPKGERLRI